MRIWTYRAFALILGVAIASCADPIEDEPIAVVTIDVEGLPPEAESPHIGLVWQPLYSWRGQVWESDYVPIPPNSTQLSFPVLYEPPEFSLANLSGFRMVPGSFFAFDDRDGNGRLDDEDGDDVVFALPPRDLVLYSKLDPGAEVPGWLFTNPEAYTPGLIRIRTPPPDCLGPFEILPIDTPVVFFQADEIGPGEECPSQEECLAFCEPLVEAIFQGCVEDHGPDRCIRNAICADLCQMTE
nr:MAG: hypothetical protein DIU72_08455 [Pseudomonadota bacterium]